MSEIDSVLSAVGPRLRDVRQRRGRTLADVAEETGISVSTLSRLESGGRRPSLDLLLPLATAYRVQLDELVGAPQTADPRVHPRPVTRHGRIYIPLTPNAPGIQAIKMILPGLSRDLDAQTWPELRVHTGYEWVYVLSGTLRLALEDTVTLLGPGEAAEFDTRVPHSVTSADEKAVELLCLVSPQGERIHVGGV